MLVFEEEEALMSGVSNTGGGSDASRAIERDGSSCSDSEVGSDPEMELFEERVDGGSSRDMFRQCLIVIVAAWQVEKPGDAEVGTTKGSYVDLVGCMPTR